MTFKGNDMKVQPSIGLLQMVRRMTSCTLCSVRHAIHATRMFLMLLADFDLHIDLLLADYDLHIELLTN